jgi:hypothetical protein
VNHGLKSVSSEDVKHPYSKLKHKEYNGQKKNDRYSLQNGTQQTKIVRHESHKEKTGVNKLNA